LLIVAGVLPHVFLLFFHVGGLIPLRVHILFVLSTTIGVFCGFFVLGRMRKNSEIFEEQKPKLRALKWLIALGLMDIVLTALVVIIGTWSLLFLGKQSDERGISPEFCRIAVVDPSQPLPREAEHRKVFLESVCTIHVKIEKISDPKHCTLAVRDPSAPLKTEDENYIDWLMNTSGCPKVDIVAL
jgi:hypothetical protein